MPDQFELDVVAIARWRWLIAFPQLQRLQTRERQAAHDQALARLDRAALQRLGVEPIEPGGRPPSGSWDSAVRIKGRMQTRDSGRRGGLGFELDGGGRVGRAGGRLWPGRERVAANVPATRHMKTTNEMVRIQEDFTQGLMSEPALQFINIMQYKKTPAAERD